MALVSSRSRICSAACRVQSSTRATFFLLQTTSHRVPPSLSLQDNASASSRSAQCVAYAFVTLLHLAQASRLQALICRNVISNALGWLDSLDWIGLIGASTCRSDYLRAHKYIQICIYVFIYSCVYAMLCVNWPLKACGFASFVRGFFPFKLLLLFISGLNVIGVASWQDQFAAALSWMERWSASMLKFACKCVCESLLCAPEAVLLALSAVSLAHVAANFLYNFSFKLICVFN